MCDLEEVTLTVDGRLYGLFKGLYREKLRLKWKSHARLSVILLAAARKKIANALVNAKALKINGGVVHYKGNKINFSINRRLKNESLHLQPKPTKARNPRFTGILAVRLILLFMILLAASLRSLITLIGIVLMGHVSR